MVRLAMKLAVWLQTASPELASRLFSYTTPFASDGHL
jgi:hypothetical protein